MRACFDIFQDPNKGLNKYLSHNFNQQLMGQDTYYIDKYFYANVILLYIYLHFYVLLC